MSTFIVLLTLFISLEIFESNWQKSDTFLGVIYNNYLMFKKGVFLYFFANITFIYTIFLSIYLQNFSFWMSSIMILKFFDIVFRLTIIKQLDSGKELNEIIPIDMKMNFYFRYINVLIYPLAFIFAVV